MPLRNCSLTHCISNATPQLRIVHTPTLTLQARTLHTCTHARTKAQTHVHVGVSVSVSVHTSVPDSGCLLRLLNADVLGSHWGCTMCAGVVDIQSATAKIRQGKKRTKIEETKSMKFTLIQNHIYYVLFIT